MQPTRHRQSADTRSWSFRGCMVALACGARPFGRCVLCKRGTLGQRLYRGFQSPDGGGGRPKDQHDKACGMRMSPLAILRSPYVPDRSRRMSFRSVALLGARGRSALAFVGALVLVVMRCASHCHALTNIAECFEAARMPVEDCCRRLRHEPMVHVPKCAGRRFFSHQAQRFPSIVACLCPPDCSGA